MLSDWNEVVLSLAWMIPFVVVVVFVSLLGAKRVPRIGCAHASRGQAGRQAGSHRTHLRARNRDMGQWGRKRREEKRLTYCQELSAVIASLTRPNERVRDPPPSSPSSWSHVVRT